jgi:hypothetical protein
MPKYFVVFQYNSDNDSKAEKKIDILLQILDDNCFSYEDVSNPTRLDIWEELANG